MNNIELTQESVDTLILTELVQILHDTQVKEDLALIKSLNVVIAYYSVPGTYKEGSYDA
jgi:hypothetical protein